MKKSTTAPLICVSVLAAVLFSFAVFLPLNMRRGTDSGTESGESSDTADIPEAERHSIRWYVDGEEVFFDSEYSYYSQNHHDFMFPLPAEKEGMVFTGWYENNETLLMKLDGTEDRDISLYADYIDSSLDFAFESATGSKYCNDATEEGVLDRTTVSVSLNSTANLLEYGYSYSIVYQIDETSGSKVKVTADGAHTTKYKASETYSMYSGPDDSGVYKPVFSNTVSVELAANIFSKGENTTEKQPESYVVTMPVESSDFKVIYECDYSVTCGSKGGTGTFVTPDIAVTANVRIALP